MSFEKVAALCVASNSVYLTMPDVIAFDKNRDVRTFSGGIPVVTHAPCRAWSAHCSHQAKPEPGEKDLAYLCAHHLKVCGGVFEHPAHSRAFKACGLPLPGHPPHHGLWTLEVWQSWWGYPMMKRTWLCFAHIDPKQIRLPFTLHPKGFDRRREQVMSKNQRAATNPTFARWLVDLAKTVNP